MAVLGQTQRRLGVISSTILIRLLALARSTFKHSVTIGKKKGETQAEEMIKIICYGKLFRAILSSLSLPLSAAEAKTV
jgi:hypothetical protein